MVGDQRLCDACHYLGEKMVLRQAQFAANEAVRSTRLASRCSRRQGPRSRPYLRRRRAGRAIFRGDCKAAGVPTFETPRWPFSQGGRSQPAGGINQSVMSAPTAISDSTAFAIMSAGQGMTFTDGAGGGGPG
jgi:hypothetical protein